MCHVFFEVCFDCPAPVMREYSGGGGKLGYPSPDFHASAAPKAHREPSAKIIHVATKGMANEPLVGLYIDHTTLHATLVEKNVVMRKRR